jgi:hypothetical protein
MKLLENIERRNRNGGDEGLAAGRVKARVDGQTVYDSNPDHEDDGDDGYGANARSRRPQSFAELDPAEVYARFNAKRG